MAKQSLVDKTGKKIQKWAGVVGAILTILGAITGACSWVSNQFANAVGAQISDFQQEVRTSDRENKQAIARIELTVLIEHDPENTIAIEKMAKYYFQELNGDLYMTQKVSDWCTAHDRDCTVLMGEK